MSPKKTTSQAPIKPSAAKRHSGKWVALRGMRVAASAATYGELQAHPRVRDTDAVYRVPAADRHHFLATRAN